MISITNLLQQWLVVHACKLVALKVPFHALIRCIDFKGIDETNRTHLRFETRHTLSSMSHKPNLLSWDQDVAASPHEFHETDNNRTNFAAVLATWQYFFFRHIRFSKLLSYHKLSQIIIFYFKMFCHWSKAKDVSRSPENYHLLQK